MIDTLPAPSAAPIACTLTAPELARRQTDVQAALFRQATSVEELPDGYAWQFPSNGDMLHAITEFVSAERECCRFFTFEIVVEPDLGPMWLRLRGTPDAKAFMAQTFGSGIQLISVDMMISGERPS